MFIVSILLFVASIVQGVIGYGMALVANPILVLIDPGFVPGPMLLTAFILSILIVVREHTALDLSGLGWAVAGRVLGSVVSAWLLVVVSQDAMIVLFAVLVLLAVLITGSGVRIPINRPNLVIAGTLAGVMGTIASIGGPPMALLYQNSSGPRLRTTLAGFFIVGTFISIFALFSVGRFGWRDVQLSLILLPGTLLGYFASTRFIAKLNPRAMRLAVLGISGVSAIVVLLRQVL